MSTPRSATPRHSAPSRLTGPPTNSALGLAARSTSGEQVVDRRVRRLVDDNADAAAFVVLDDVDDGAREGGFGQRRGGDQQRPGPDGHRAEPAIGPAPGAGHRIVGIVAAHALIMARLAHARRYS